MKVKEKTIRKILDKNNIAIVLRPLIINMSKEVLTPEELADFLYAWIEQLEHLIYILDEDYRDNWHIIHCECRDCIKLDKELR